MLKNLGIRLRNTMLEALFAHLSNPQQQVELGELIKFISKDAPKDPEDVRMCYFKVSLLLITRLDLCKLLALLSCPQRSLWKNAEPLPVELLVLKRFEGPQHGEQSASAAPDR